MSSVEEQEARESIAESLAEELDRQPTDLEMDQAVEEMANLQANPDVPW